MKRKKNKPCRVRRSSILTMLILIILIVSTQENLHLNPEKPALFEAGWMGFYFDSVVPTIQTFSICSCYLAAPFLQEAVAASK